MSVIRRFFWGAVICAAGFAALLVGVRMVYGERAAGNEEAASALAPEIKAAPETAPAPAAATPAPLADPNLGNPANRDLKINDAGLEIIKQSEGLQLDAYQSGGHWFIGYGHLGAKPGQTISQAEADRLLRQDVVGAENGVKRLVIVPVNENEFSAMVSLAYNLGIGNFGRSSVLEKINAGDRKGAADAFLRHNKAGGVVNEHLTQRREKERALFLSSS